MQPDETAEQYVDTVMASNNKDRVRFLIADAIRRSTVDALNQKDRAFTALAKAHADAREAIKGCEATATCLVAERRQAHEALEECRKVLRRICTDSDHDMWASVFRPGMFSDAEAALSLADAILGT